MSATRDCEPREPDPPLGPLGVAVGITVGVAEGAPMMKTSHAASGRHATIARLTIRNRPILPFMRFFPSRPGLFLYPHSAIASASGVASPERLTTADG
jgi:hypothetical protein